MGAKSYGRAPTFLMATGFEQARSVVAALAGDWTAARDVRLELPETGVCSSGVPDSRDQTAGGSCCGPRRRRARATRGDWPPVSLADSSALPLVSVAVTDGNDSCCT